MSDMRVTIPLLLCLLFALVGVHTQTTPYLNFMDKNISNNSYIYIDLNKVGQNKLYCYTDLSTCCSEPLGPDRGDWYFPNKSRLQFSGNVYEGRGDQLVVLEYKGSDVTSGIYRCDIETIAVNNNTGRESLFVGLYASGGE